MRRILALISVMAFMVVLTAMPALAQPVFTGGLVNITVTDVLNNNQVNVQVPIGVAANVCGVAVNVLASEASQGPVDCTAATTQDLPVRFRP
jgi:hypothetical protein